MHLYIFCKSCKRRQKLESEDDPVISRFVKYHNTHNIFIDTIERMGYDTLAFTDQWIGKKPEYENIKPQTPVESITEALYQKIAQLESKNRDLKLALFDLKASIAPSPEDRATLSEGYKEVLKDVVREGSRIARNETIPLNEKEIDEIHKAADEKIRRLPKEVRGVISEVVEE